jgi:hypothetical protein
MDRFGRLLGRALAPSTDSTHKHDYSTETIGEVYPNKADLLSELTVFTHIHVQQSGDGLAQYNGAFPLARLGVGEGQTGNFDMQ